MSIAIKQLEPDLSLRDLGHTPSECAPRRAPQKSARGTVNDKVLLSTFWSALVRRFLADQLAQGGFRSHGSRQLSLRGESKVR